MWVLNQYTSAIKVDEFHSRIAADVGDIPSSSGLSQKCGIVVHIAFIIQFI